MTTNKNAVNEQKQSSFINKGVDTAGALGASAPADFEAQHIYMHIRHALFTNLVNT